MNTRLRVNEDSDKSLNEDKAETGICKNAGVMFSLHLLLNNCLFFCFYSYREEACLHVRSAHQLLAPHFIFPLFQCIMFTSPNFRKGMSVFYA